MEDETMTEERQEATVLMKCYTPFSYGTTYSALSGFALDKHWGKIRRLGIRVQKRP